MGETKKRGGARPGSGRPKGSVTVLTAKAREAARERHGILPHEWLLKVMLGEQLIEGVVPTFEQRLDAAKAAAPYYAPRLATHTVTGAEGKPLIPDSVEDRIAETARRWQFLLDLAARNGVSIQPPGDKSQRLQ